MNQENLVHLQKSGEVLKTPPSAAAFMELARVCEKTGRLTESLKYLAAAMQKEPNDPAIWCNLGNTLFHIGETQKGIELVEKAVKVQPENAMLHSNFLFRLHDLPTLESSPLFDEHKKWALKHAPIHLAKKNHGNIPDLGRKIRIGYISPDFCAHPVGFFFEPLLERDHSQIELYGYGDVEFQDAFTEQIKAGFDLYREIRGIDDKQAAALIERDKIDILVDLAGHTGGNRLGVLTYKPAPVQATYLGYFETTGMEQIDYFLTDEKISPPFSQQFHTEKLLPFSQCCLCYIPKNTAIPVAESPCIKNGCITFGMFGNSTKMNSNTISLWAKILQNTEKSRMVLMFKGGQDKEIADRFRVIFEQFGISSDRIDFLGRKSYVEYLEAHKQVDIMLDTFPYNGGTTTCDALWMGVPVISFVGEHHFSRVGLSILSSVGLEFFTASTPNEYVSKACALAAKPDALAKIRNSMRARIASSPLCDAKNFTKNLEKAYRQIWCKWCESRNQQ